MEVRQGTHPWSPGNVDDKGDGFYVERVIDVSNQGVKEVGRDQ